MKTAATPAPTAAEWRSAFFDVEGKLNRLESRIKLADYLAGCLADRAGEVSASVAGLGGLATLAEAMAWAVFHVADAMKEADDAYYAAFNDLVGRENEALAARKAVP